MVVYPFDNKTVVKDHSNHMVVKEVVMEVTREVQIEASPEEVWEALITEEGRERWLGEPAREVHVEALEPPHRLVWWWGSEAEPFTRVDFRILASPVGTRVIVTESSPAFPLATLAASFVPVLA
jgi:uncharacterized protein YndB with AHSA1/START domain